MPPLRFSLSWWAAKSFRANRRFWSWPNEIRDLIFARVWRKKVNETLSRPWMWWPEVLHCATIYRRKERVRRCRSSVMKGTVIWLHLLCALYINGAGRQAGQEGGSGQAVHVPPQYTLYIQQRRQQQRQQQRGRLSWMRPRRQEGSSGLRRDFRIISGNSSNDRYMISRPVGRYSFIFRFFFSKNGALAQNYHPWGHSVRWHQDLEDMTAQESRLLRFVHTFLNSLHARTMKIPVGTR